MKKIVLFLLSFILTITGFADHLTIENQTSYPSKNQKSKIAVQWANTIKDVEAGNAALLTGEKLHTSSLNALKHPGATTLTIPKNAEYFRVIVWSKDEGSPDLLTNWVDAVPNKTYTLKGDHLVPLALIAGSGC